MVLQQLEKLTNRERDVLRLIFANRGSIQRESMAIELSVSPRTITAHVSSIMKKLGAKTHIDIVLLAIDPSGLQMSKISRDLAKNDHRNELEQAV